MSSSTIDEFTPVQKAAFERICHLGELMAKSSPPAKELIKEDLAKAVVVFANFSYMTWRNEISDV